jgi:UDP-N-acetyl-D-galactosamine dehydrogenase
MGERIAMVGLGYVGLPVALGFGRHFPTVAFDIDAKRVQELRDGIDRTQEASREELRQSSCTFTADPADLSGCTFFIVAVPTPIDEAKQPDLRALEAASRTVGGALEPGAVVVYESTVYPGVTEEICGPILEAVSGLQRGRDFTLGYSPERINPGDKEHTLERIVKVVSGEDAPTLERVAQAYGTVVTAGVHRAPTIRVAEAAKVIENTQRDLNIALMNELALIFDRLGIRTKDVLEAAGTKWNFLRFTPGLVGGHCIGVDPYYLTRRAQMAGYNPEVILAGRRINDAMGAHVARGVIKALARDGKSLRSARIGVLGITFKENVPDLRNSRVPDILAELESHGATPLVHDPLADPKEALQVYGVELQDLDSMGELDALVLAVPHDELVRDEPERLLVHLRPGGVVYDIKSVLDPKLLDKEITYLSL